MCHSGSPSTSASVSWQGILKLCFSKTEIGLSDILVLTEYNGFKLFPRHIAMIDVFPMRYAVEEMGEAIIS